MVLLILAAPLVQASPWDTFGQGGARLGRAGGGMAIPENIDSIVANPAALAGMPAGEVGLGVLFADSAFLPTPDLYWDTNVDGRIDDTDPALQASPDYEPVRGFSVAITHPFGRYIAGGLTAYFPMQRLLELDSFEPSIPTYFMYANRLQRYDLALELAARPFGGLAIGAGLQLIPHCRYTLDAALNLTVQSPEDTPEDTGDTTSDGNAGDILSAGLDVHRMSLDVVPDYAPNVSLHWDAGQAIPALDGLYLGAAWRGTTGLPVDVDINLQVNAGTEAIGDIAPVTLPIYASLQLLVYDHYQPAQLTFGAAYAIQDAFTVSADLRRTAWDRMEINIARVMDASIESAAVDLSDLTVVDGNPYDIRFRSTWSPRVGADLRFPAIATGKKFGDVRAVTRGGFGYEPTALVSQTADTALLDSNRLLFAVGAGVEHDDPLHPTGPHRMHWDAFFQYQLLQNGELDRGQPSTPTAGYARDGSPIPIGGHLYAAGLAWRSEY